MGTFDITAAPLEELVADHIASVQDVMVCRSCLHLGVTHQRDGGSVQERLEVNEKIIAMIEAEFNRRGL